jgi:hypothetical protein
MDNLIPSQRPKGSSARLQKDQRVVVYVVRALICSLPIPIHFYAYEIHSSFVCPACLLLR